MENYDLSTITRDNLHFLLSTAKDEIIKYTRCIEDVERCKKRIDENKKKSNANVGCWIAVSCFIVILGVIVAVAIMSGEKVVNGSPDMPPFLPLVPFGVIGFLLISMTVGEVKARKEAQRDVQKDEAKLPNLQKIAKDAMNEFKAVLFIPIKYWDEYALTTMFEYVDDKEASNWERVTDLYRDHKHKLKVEAQTRIQTELAEETRNAARLAAAGTWAAAAGIWSRK